MVKANSQQHNWHSKTIQGWTIRIEGGGVTSNTAWLEQHSICYVSPHTKKASFGKNVFVSTKELAEQFSEAILPTMKRRHGNEIVLMVEACDDKPKRGFDDPIVLARLAAQNFATNKSPC